MHQFRHKSAKLAKKIGKIDNFHHIIFSIGIKGNIFAPEKL